MSRTSGRQNEPALICGEAIAGRPHDWVARTEKPIAPTLVIREAQLTAQVTSDLQPVIAGLD